ncbi:glycosyltransferase [Stagnimonas aquatica]|uniref:Glycosyltransferase n=2 Tax=Stagnimonas aquatica TaxID=2689987 RepID=A0A3N0VHC1_9GAMM|nr:glycosyltransferase [Stagnimonas aquatica]
MLADCLAARLSATPVTPKLVFSSNGQGVALAGTDLFFAKAMEQADWIHADGMSIVLASKRATTSLPERVATTDFFHDAAEVAVANGLSFYMLGGTEQQNRKACEAIAQLYPQLKLVGRRNGYFKPEEEEMVCADITNARPDVLWVAMGKPAQELWCVRNRDRLGGVAWIKTCGGLYAFLAGDAVRAPEWMQRWGLEWLHRALQEPGRLLWRYLVTNPNAIYRLIRYTR